TLRMKRGTGTIPGPASRLIGTTVVGSACTDRVQAVLRRARRCGHAALFRVIVALSLGALGGGATAASFSGESQTANRTPLAPAGSAGIKQAQASQTGGILLGAAVTGGIFVAILLLVDGDDSGPITSTTTTSTTSSQ